MTDAEIVRAALREAHVPGYKPFYALDRLEAAERALRELVGVLVYYSGEPHDEFIGVRETAPARAALAAAEAVLDGREGER